MALYDFALQALEINRFAAYIVVRDMVVVSFTCVYILLCTFLSLLFFFFARLLKDTCFIGC